MTLTDYVYVSGKEERRGLVSIEDSVDTSIKRLEDYIEKCGGRLITPTRNKTDNTRSNRMEITRKQKWEEKQVYGRFERRKNVDVTKKVNLKRGTESLLIAAQNNVKRTNHIKARIDKTQQNSRCRLCGDRDETINHISECSKSAQKNWTRLGGQGDPLGILQEIWIRPYEQIVYMQSRILSWRMRRTNYSGIWRYKRIT